MSPNSSPACSGTGSGTPSSSDSPGKSSPQQLTPRSKIKALVAAIDDESDQERRSPLRKPGTNVGDHADKTNGRSVGRSDSSSVESGSSTREPVRARGKLAARLQRKRSIDKILHGSPTTPQADDENAENAGNAYERVRRWMLPRNSPGNQQTSLSQGLESMDDEDHEPMVPRRRRKAEPTGENTPQSPIATPTRSRKSSPGLFLTPGGESTGKSPSKATVNDESSSDSDLPANPLTSERLSALVAKKRAERKAREAMEAEKRAAREAQYMQQDERRRSRQSATPLGESEDDSDDVAARKMTQQARPTRKASKKALEEMSRETQRMNRNMQLAHQARTNKKITKESLFARFNFRTTNDHSGNTYQAQTSSTVVSSAHVSETEGVQHQATPPSSPPTRQDSSKPCMQDSAAALGMAFPAVVSDEDEALPTLDEVLNEPRHTSEKGKLKAVDHTAEDVIPAPALPKALVSKPTIKIKLPKISTRSKNQQEDSESDLEIVAPQKSKASRLAVFDRFSTGKLSEARSLHKLRTMAHLDSPEKRSGKSRASMSSSEMHMSLQQRARKQAAAERAEKIQDLKDRGIIVQTAEERQRDQAEVQDLLEKARQEAVGIKKKEKEAARRAAKRNGEDFNDSSEEDEEYQANEADESDIELSGSEDEAAIDQGSGDELDADGDAEDDEEEDEVSMGDEEKHGNGLVEDEAMEDSLDEDSSATGEIADDDMDMDQDEGAQQLHRRTRVCRIIEDDDEEPSVIEPSQDRARVLETPEKPMIPKIALGTSPGLLGMTQAFAATLADSQTQAIRDVEIATEQDSMGFLGPVPEPNVPVYDANDTGSMVLDSQNDNNATEVDTNAGNVNFDFTQSQIEYEHYPDSQDAPMATQDMEMPEPTQDMGFHLSSPAGNRFVSAPPSTVDTVLLPEQSPIKKKKGRLQRGRKESIGLSDADEEVPISPQQSADFDISANAFDVMKQKRSAAVTAQAFDKKKSKAKEMVEEQAQESEDEYAGLGGASDDESVGEEDEDLKKMIEEGDVEVDERKLAAFYAEKERAADEQAISKLHKDINNGGLRRKGGADFDLSDSDDDAEARHRAKRREHARMRKLMFSDEKLSKIADNPKKMAFLRAIEDREDEEDLGVGWEILATPEEGEKEGSTQEVADSQSKPASNDTTGSKRKRPLQESLPDAANRPPPTARRTKTRKPATLAEIRESVSFLIETPESMSFQSHADSSDLEAEIEHQAPTIGDQASDDEANAAETENGKDLMPPPPLPTHSNPRRTSAAIIDRLSLKRASTADQASSTRLAFAAPNTLNSDSTFRVPSLLRRASTSNLANQADKHGISTLAATEQTAGGADDREGFVRKGGRKGSSILAQARQMERRAVLDGVEKRRQAERERIARCRREGFLVKSGSWEG